MTDISLRLGSTHASESRKKKQINMNGVLTARNNISPFKCVRYGFFSSIVYCTNDCALIAHTWSQAMIAGCSYYHIKTIASNFAHFTVRMAGIERVARVKN